LKRPIAPLLLASAILLAACGSQPSARPTTALTVFAAASLTDTFAELARRFEAAHPGTQVVLNFANSAQLAQQIDQGAPVDVFASAGSKPMDDAIKSGRILSETVQVFVKNRLVVIFPKDAPTALASLHDLARPGLKLVLAVKEAPVGQYSLDFLDRTSQGAAFTPGFRDVVLDNVVSYEETVRGVLSKIALGEADAGIVYTSDITGENAASVSRLDIPDHLNIIATYPIAPIQDSANPDLAQAFIDLVLSMEGQTLLEKHGFIRVK
jgi:molybdate transport system substrate-binding protein